MSHRFFRRRLFRDLCYHTSKRLSGHRQEIHLRTPFYYGYVITAVATLIITVCFGIVYSFGLFLEPLRAHFGWTKGAISGAYSLYFFIHGFLYIAAGRLNDRFGPRVVVTACCTIVGVS
jgi:MFS family permease